MDYKAEWDRIKRDVEAAQRSQKARDALTWILANVNLTHEERRVLLGLNKKGIDHAGSGRRDTDCGGGDLVDSVAETAAAQSPLASTVEKALGRGHAGDSEEERGAAGPEYRVAALERKLESVEKRLALMDDRLNALEQAMRTLINF